MFGKDVIVPPGHLYQEGNTVNKYSNKQKRSFFLKKKKKELTGSGKEKKIHKYHKDDLGNLIDVEV